MDIKIKHNGVDISSNIQLSSCYLYDRYGGLLDNLSFSFPYETSDLILNKYDEIEISANGYSSGVMYLDSIYHTDGAFQVNAISNKPSNKVKHSRIWLDVKLSRLISDIAENCGLNVKTYGIEDYIYKYISQMSETDLQFLSRICEREGYSIKCENGSLIVFNEYYIENNYPTFDLSANDVSSAWNFNRAINGLSKAIVSYYNHETGTTIESYAEDIETDGGTDLFIFPCSSPTEAYRYAKGKLRAANKNYITGQISMEYKPSLSAGSCLNLTGFNDFDGKYVIYELTHDLVREKTIIKVRKTLAY